MTALLKINEFERGCLDHEQVLGDLCNICKQEISITRLLLSLKVFAVLRNFLIRLSTVLDEQSLCILGNKLLSF